MSVTTTQGHWGRRPWTVWCGATLLVTVALWSADHRGADAQVDLTNFAAVGSAEGVRYNAVIVGAPLTNDVADVATPVAQSEVDSVGGSNAFAAIPYPGETVLTGPALATGAAGLPALPGFPVLATSSHPFEPEEDIDQPGLRIRAKSDATTSEAVATTGGSTVATGVGRVSAESASSLDPAKGELQVDATSLAEVISIEGLLRIGAVEGVASVSLTPGGEVKRSSRLVVGDVTVAGQSARITEQGVVVGNSPSGLPAGPEIDLLADAGIRARLLAPAESDDGVVSGALQITIVSEGPSGPVTQTYTFGRASARVTSRGGAPIDDGTGGAPIAAPPSDDGLPAPSFGDASGLPSPSGTDAPTPTAAGPTPPPTGPASAPTFTSSPVASAFPLDDTLSFYLAIVLAGLVVVGATQLVRIMGVRSAWIS